MKSTLKISKASTKCIFRVHRLIWCLLLVTLFTVTNAVAQLMPSAYYPAINSTSATADIVSLRYNTLSTLSKGSGNITVYSPGGLWETIAVSSSNVRIDPASGPTGFWVSIIFSRPMPDGALMTVNIPASAFNTNAVGGFGEIFNTWNFTTSPSGPILYSRTPTVGSSVSASTTSFALNFHENISKGSGSIIFKNKNTNAVVQSVDVNSAAVTIPSPRVASINLANPLPQGVDYILEMAAGVFKDAGNANSVAVNDVNTWFRISDQQAPVLQTSTPGHQASINVSDRVVTFTFNESVVRGTGRIYFKNKNTGATIYEASLFSSDVVQSGNTLTITKPTNWPFGVTVAVTAPNTVIMDMAGNFWAGISGNNDFNFTTCSSATPSVSIALTSGTNPSCASQPLTFTATPTNAGTSPSYQWKVNGVNTGTNSATFTSSTLTNGQVVSCVLTSNATCATSTTATSNNITVGISAIVTPTVAITGNTTICSGNSVTFNASVTNAGSTPIYQWKVNGANVGTNQNFFTSNTLTHGQIVTCEITRDNSGCISTTTATSNSLTMAVGSMPAQPSVITGNASVCQGSTSTYSVTNVTGVIYSWDTGGAGTITGSGNSISVTWTSSGAKTLIAYPTNSCGTGTARTLAVTVNGVPAQPSVIAGSTSVGQNQANQYSVTSESGTTYTWSAGTGGTITGSGNAVSITWSSAGSKTITVTPSTTCGSGIARTLSVNVGSCPVPAQPSTISGNTTACVGGTGTYSVTNVGGVSYSWDAGVDGNVSGDGNSVTLSWSSPGTKTITVTPFSDCGTGTSRTATVVVSALPSQPSTITGNTIACINSSNTYSVTNVSGIAYTWDTGGKGTVTGSGNSVSVQWTAAGTNVLTVTPSNGCGIGLARSISVTVNNVPLGTSAIAGENLKCTGVSGTYSVTNVSGVNYTWSAGAGGTVTGSGNSVSINWSSGGDKVVQVTPSNSCGNGIVTSLTVSVTATPAQPSTITGSTSIDAGTLNTYSVTNVAGVSYTWSATDGVIIGSGNSVQVSWANGGTKTLTVTPSNICGNGTARSVSVNVATPCTIPATSSVIITSGSANTTVNQTLRMQVTFSTGATSYDLSVFPSTGITLTPVSGNTWDVTFANAGVYTVSGKGVSACGTSAPALLDVNVCGLSIDPPASVTGQITNVCPGSTTRYTVNSPLEGYSYDWNLGGATGVTISYLNAQRTVADITWTTDWAGVNVTVRSKNACNVTSTFGTTVSVELGAKPAVVSINTTPGGTICVGGSSTFTITNPQAGVTYNWNLNGAGTIAGDKLSATVLADGQSRSIKVLGTNSCYVNEEVTSIIFGGGTPNPALPSPVVGPTTLDFNTDGTFTVEAQPGVNFSWGAGGDATITNTASPNSKLIRWSTGGIKTIDLLTSNNCGISSLRSYSLYVVGPCDAPSIPDPITGPSTGCANNEYTFSVPFQPNTTYNWSAGGDATITGTGTTRTIKWTTSGSKTITVSATNGCTTSAGQTKGFVITPVPAQPAGLTGGLLACSGETEEFLVNPTTGGVTYAWEVQGGSFVQSGTQNERVNITWSSAGTNVIKVKASNACGFGQERSITRVIETIPLQPSVITGESEVCAGTQKPFSVSSVTGVSYVWSGGTGASVTGSGNAVNISWSSTGAKTVTVTPSNACGSGPSRTLSITTSGIPSQPSAITGNASPVVGSTVSYSVTNVSGVNYTWSLSDKGLLSGGGNAASATWNAIGSATLSVTPSNACGSGTVRSQVIAISKMPQAIAFTLPGTALANAEIIFNGVSDSGLPISYASSNTSIAEVSGNTLIIKAAGTVNITASQPGDATYAAAANVVRSLTISKATQTITFEAFTAKGFGDAPFSAEAIINSTLQISFASSNPAVATITSDGTISVVGVGSTSITASQGGDAIYNAATPVSRTLTVNKANQTITFQPIVAKGISDPPFILDAIASSGLEVTYTSSNPAVAEVSGNTVIIIGNGSTIITASQAGNANYNAAINVQQTLTVTSQTRIIALSGSLSFGEVIVGEPETKTLTISNTGNEALTITNITYPNRYSGDKTSAVINAGASVQVNVTFSPEEPKAYGGNISITSNATSGVSTLAVSGTGISITAADNPVVNISQVYPNPVQHELFVELTGQHYADMNEVLFYDVTGKATRLTLDATFEVGKYRCDITALKAGVYLLALPGQKNLRRIVKTN